MHRREFLKYFLMCSAAAVGGCQALDSYVLNHGTIPRNKPRYAGNQRQQLNMMLYNIANARGNTDDFWACPREETVIRNLDRIVDLAKQEDADILCLNECDFDSIRTHNIDQAEYISSRGGYPYIVKDTMFSIPSMIELGNAVLSKHPLQANMNRQYGEDFPERVCHIFKSFVDVDIIVPGYGPLNLVLTHLDAEHTYNRAEEISILLDHLSSKTDEFILLGDFNSGPGKEEFGRITESGIVHNRRLGIPSYPSDAPERSIDHIMVSYGLKIDRYHVRATPASDHRAVFGRVIF